MSEIEKLYENARVLKECLSPCYINKTWRKTHDCPNCDNREYYPPFTAEKQIELIKWLSDTDYYIHNIYKTIDTKEYCIENDFYDIQTNKFEEALARLINKHWQDLTEEEKQQVKGILE